MEFQIRPEAGWVQEFIRERVGKGIIFVGTLALAVLALLLPILPVTSWATVSDPGGVVTGKVSGPGNVPVPGAMVVLFNFRSHTRKETWSDESGRYVFRDVPPGEYRTFVVIVGFRSSILGPLEVTTSKRSELNVTLTLARPGEPSGFAAFRRPGEGQLRPAERPGPGRRSGRFAQLGRGKPSGRPNQQAGLPGSMRPGNAADLSSIVAASGESDETGSLRFSSKESGAGRAGPGRNGASVNLAGAAGSSNSFLLSGNVVDATAPPMERRGRRRSFRLGGPGGPAGVPFGGGGDRVFFFGGFRRARANGIRGKIFDSYTNSAFDARPYPLNTPSQSQAPFLELPLAVETAYFLQPDGHYYVVLAAKIPGSSIPFRQHSSVHQTQFDFTWRATDSNGKVAGGLRDTLPVKLNASTYQNVLKGNILYEGGIVLPPGTYKLRVVVGENLTGKMGTFEKSLVLPPTKKAGLELSSVVVSNELSKGHQHGPREAPGP